MIFVYNNISFLHRDELQAAIASFFVRFLVFDVFLIKHYCSLWKVMQPSVPGTP